MKYALYSATDTRDNRRMLWLHDTGNHRVATFCTKWAPSRIKQYTAAAPEGIVWERGNALDQYTSGVPDKIAEWEMPG
jgi:hypothetical protein